MNSACDCEEVVSTRRKSSTLDFCSDTSKEPSSNSQWKSKTSSLLRNFGASLDLGLKKKKKKSSPANGRVYSVDGGSGVANHLIQINSVDGGSGVANHLIHRPKSSPCLKNLEAQSLLAEETQQFNSENQYSEIDPAIYYTPSYFHVDFPDRDSTSDSHRIITESDSRSKSNPKKKHSISSISPPKIHRPWNLSLKKPLSPHPENKSSENSEQDPARSLVLSRSERCSTRPVSASLEPLRERQLQGSVSQPIGPSLSSNSPPLEFPNKPPILNQSPTLRKQYSAPVRCHQSPLPRRPLTPPTGRRHALWIRPFLG